MARSKWNEVKKKLETVELWASMGLSDSQIAFNLGISKDTFYRYKKEHSDFSDTLKRGKNVANFKVENSLYKKATGYIIHETGAVKVKETYYDDQGRKCTKEDVKLVDYEKEVPADVAAIKFWLINRSPERWKDNPTRAEIDKALLNMKKDEAGQRKKMLEELDE